MPYYIDLIIVLTVHPFDGAEPDNIMLLPDMLTPSTNVFVVPNDDADTSL
jgi:hypothetical protein